MLNEIKYNLRVAIFVAVMDLNYILLPLALP